MELTLEPSDSMERQDGMELTSEHQIKCRSREQRGVPEATMEWLKVLAEVEELARRWRLQRRAKYIPA